MDVSDAADVTAPDMHVSSVRIDGVCHTSHDLLASITAPLLAQHSLPAIADSSARIVRHLQLLGIFKAVSVVLDTPDAESSQNLINVVFTVVEAPRLYAKTGVDFGSTEGSMVFVFKTESIAKSAQCPRKGRKPRAHFYIWSRNQLVYKKERASCPQICAPTCTHQADWWRSAAHCASDCLRTRPGQF